MIKNTTKNVLVPKEIITNTDIVCDNCRKVLADKDMYFNMKIGLKTITDESSADAWDSEFGTKDDSSDSGSSSDISPSVVIEPNSSTYKLSQDSPIKYGVMSSLSDIRNNVSVVESLFKQITISKVGALSNYVTAYDLLVKVNDIVDECDTNATNNDFGTLTNTTLPKLLNTYIDFVAAVNNIAYADSCQSVVTSINSCYNKDTTDYGTSFYTTYKIVKANSADVYALDLTLSVSPIEYIRYAMNYLCTASNELISAWSIVKNAKIDSSLTDLQTATTTFKDLIYDNIMSLRSILVNIKGRTVRKSYDAINSTVSSLEALKSSAEEFKTTYGSSFGSSSITSVIDGITTAYNTTSFSLSELDVCPTKDTIVSEMESLVAENIDNDTVYEYQCCSNECVDTLINHRNEILKKSNEYKDRRLTVAIRKDYVTVGANSSTTDLGNEATALDYHNYYNVGDTMTFSNSVIGDVEFVVIGKDHDGENTLTIMTKDIVRIVPFDGKEPNRIINGDDTAAKEGFNNYTCANIRKWLTSSASTNWYANDSETFFVNSTETPPSGEYIRNVTSVTTDSNNANTDTVGIDIESSTAEKVITINTPINPYEHLGGIYYGFGDSFRNLLVGNHGRFVYVTDDVRKVSNGYVLYDHLFLLSREEIGLGTDMSSAPDVVPYPYFYENGTLSMDKVIAYPNKYAVSANNLPESEVANGGISTESPWPYWLRNPRVGSYSEVRVVGVNGEVCAVPAYYGYYGLRFACVIGPR